MSALERLAQELRSEGGLLAEALVEPHGAGALGERPVAADAPPARTDDDAPATASADSLCVVRDTLDVDALAARTGAGARGAAAPQEYGLVLAAVREGYLLHYGDGLGTIVQPAERDLGLLGGDRLYALGLARLAALGDLDAVSELADLISLCAQAHAGAADDDAGARALADAAWQAAARAIGDGATPALARAKERARAGEVDAADALRDAAGVPDLP